MKKKLVGFLVAVSTIAGVPAAFAAEPLIFKMADGRFYHPSSGALADSREEILAQLGLAAPPAGNPGPTAQATGHGPRTTDAYYAVALKDAVQAARSELQKRIDAWSASGESPKRVGTFDTFVDVTLAVWNENTRTIEYVDVKKNGYRLEVLTPVSYGIRVKRTNGVNSEFIFDGDGDRVVVAVRYPVFTRAKGAPGWYDLVPIVYTPWSKRIHTPEIVAWGRETLNGMLNDVYGELRSKGIRSSAYPDRLLADVIDPGLVRAIAVIEHLGLSSLTGDNGEYLMDSVLVILAANQDRAYAYSRSSAGAKGIAQFIPSTYQFLQRRTDLELDPDFETGMSDARNSLKAMIAYLDAELASMPLAVKDLFYIDQNRVHEYLAAAYNAGGVRVRRAVQRWGDAWSEPHAAVTYADAIATLRTETVLYIQKLRAVKEIFRRPLIAAMTVQGT